jgi:hypothetical protein
MMRCVVVAMLLTGLVAVAQGESCGEDYREPCDYGARRHGADAARGAAAAGAQCRGEGLAEPSADGGCGCPAND